MTLFPQLGVSLRNIIWFNLDILILFRLNKTIEAFVVRALYNYSQYSRPPVLSYIWIHQTFNNIFEFPQVFPSFLRILVKSFLFSRSHHTLNKLRKVWNSRIFNSKKKFLLREGLKNEKKIMENSIKGPVL